jgi:hypothetical protein
MLRAAKRLIMKLALIAIGLVAITGQASLAFARGGLHLLDPSLNPQHINGLPAEVRNALAHMCRGAQAQHQFAGYSQNLWTLVLHLNAFTALIAAHFARRVAAYIRSMSPPAVAIIAF